MSINLTTVTPSDAALALDPADLPLGTFVKWQTDKGYGGRSRARGVIESVTEKNYVVYNEMWQERARIPRHDRDAQYKRQFVALLTPEEYTQAVEENKREIAEINERADRERAEQVEVNRQARARRNAERAFAEANPQAFQEYLDRALAEEV